MALTVVMMMVMVVLVPTIKVALVDLESGKRASEGVSGGARVKLGAPEKTYPQHTDRQQRQTHDCTAPLCDGGHDLAKPILEQLHWLRAET